MRNELPVYFQSTPGRISISVTIIKRGGVVPYIAVAAHWLDAEWEAREAGLSFKEIGYDYSGRDVARYIMGPLEAFGIARKEKVYYLTKFLRHALN